MTVTSGVGVAKLSGAELEGMFSLGMGTVDDTSPAEVGIANPLEGMGVVLNSEVGEVGVATELVGMLSEELAGSCTAVISTSGGNTTISPSSPSACLRTR